MKIFYVSGNREQLPDAVTPLGLLYLMAATPDEHEKVLVDLCFEEDARATLRAAVKDGQPDLVALGMRNIQNNDYSGLSDNLDYYADLVRAVREVSDAPLVVGGSGFSIIPKELMERLRPDYGISGEGEEAFPRLVAALEDGGRGLDDIGGLLRCTESDVVVNPASGFLDMTTLPIPDRTLVDARYGEFAIESIQTKRGCPLKCDYCTYPIIEGRVGRVRDPATVVDEMFRALEDQPDTRHFFIVDSVFNLPPRHAKQVCRELIARDWQVPWTCYANPLGFDREFVTLARDAGCAGMEVGSDAGVDTILKKMQKGFTTKHIRRLNEICRAEGVPDCHTFILGTEGETLDDVRRSVDFLVDLDPHSAIVMIWIDDYESLDAELRAVRVALRKQIEELLLGRVNDYPHWSIPALGVNFSTKLFGHLRRAGRHGPLWQHARLSAYA
jgi:radical SAM superfamily enzyme YgiQ (UPF0313 family)